MACVSFAFLVTFAFVLGMPEKVPNSDDYIHVAEGHPELAVKPFSARVLHPWTSGALVRVGMTTAGAFTVVGFLALAVLTLMAMNLVQGFGGGGVVWPVVLFCPVLLHYMRTAYMNDLFHAALLSVLFVSLVWAEFWVFPVVFALVLCRESSLMAAGVVFCFFSFCRKWARAAGVVAAVVVGFAVVAFVTPAGGHNRHDLSTGSYILLKTGWNFLANWFGLRLWRPTFEWGCPTPLWTSKIPGLGVPLIFCDWHPETVVSTWTNFLGILSLSFAFLAASWKLVWERREERQIQLLLLITGYGLVAAIAGTATGTATFRLVGYGWPVLFITVPVLLGSALRGIGWGYLVLHLGIMWLRMAIPGELVWAEAVFCLAVIAANIVVYQRIRGQVEAGPELRMAGQPQAVVAP